MSFSTLRRALSVALLAWWIAHAGAALANGSVIYLPVVANNQASALPPADKNDIPAYVNYFRALAGVPPVTFDAALNNNCYEHARYMAENNDLTHNQNPALPYASAAGQVCAQHGDAWLGGAAGSPYWQPYQSVEGWMGSVGHRLWLIYPTTPTFGFGFYTAASANYRAGAALDVLSFFVEGAGYPGWPIRYPAAGQVGVPAERYPITLHWRYFGPTPTIGASSLTTTGGQPLAYSISDTSADAGHKGIKLIPSANLPPNTTFTVSVAGAYDGTPFAYAWSFSTGP